MEYNLKTRIIAEQKTVEEQLEKIQIILIYSCFLGFNKESKDSSKLPNYDEIVLTR